MGVIHHNAVLVTVGLPKPLAALRKWIKKTKAPMIESPLVANGYITFIMYPDGSKEGWNHSKEGDDWRNRLIAWLASQSYPDRSSSFDYVEVGYGERGTQILRTNQINRY